MICTLVGTWNVHDILHVRCRPQRTCTDDEINTTQTFIDAGVNKNCAISLRYSPVFVKVCWNSGLGGDRSGRFASQSESIVGMAKNNMTGTNVDKVNQQCINSAEDHLIWVAPLISCSCLNLHVCRELRLIMSTSHTCLVKLWPIRQTEAHTLPD